MAVSEGKSYWASGNVGVSLFVKPIPENDYTVAQCANGDVPYGVSFHGSYDPPGLSGSTVYAATTGQSLLVYHQGDVCLLTAGSAGFTAGDYLAPDAGGAGKTVAPGSGTAYGAKAQQTTPAGAKGRVEVMVGKA